MTSEHDKHVERQDNSTEHEIKTVDDEEVAEDSKKVVRFRGGCEECNFMLIHPCAWNIYPVQPSQNRCPASVCQESFKNSPRRRKQRSPSPCSQSNKIICFVNYSDPGRTTDRNTKGCCSCNNSGDTDCFQSSGEDKVSGGCCGRSQNEGSSCKCSCQSCRSIQPCGGCGSQFCGSVCSCAGSSGGGCCSPRNHKRRSEPECRGGGNSGCGGCC